MNATDSDVDPATRRTDLLALAPGVNNTIDAGMFAPNSAPVLDNNGTMMLDAINEDDTANRGTSVPAIIASAGGDRITDPDPDAAEGIAVTAVDNTHGTWQYSTNDGGTWSDFGSPSESAARLLDAGPGYRVRFVPNADFRGTVEPGITFRGCDGTSGSSGQLTAERSGLYWHYSLRGQQMLSATTRYALRALVHLARIPAETPILGRDLARGARIPANYLAKILLTLRKAGMVEASRGQGGGYRLAKRPDRILLVEVVDLLEGVRSRPGCFLGESHECCDRDACTAHRAWKNVREAYLKFLTTTTIADIGQSRLPASLGKAARKKTLVSLSGSP